MTEQIIELVVKQIKDEANTAWTLETIANWKPEVKAEIEKRLDSQ